MYGPNDVVLVWVVQKVKKKNVKGNLSILGSFKFQTCLKCF